MKKRWIVPGLLVAAFALAATGLADPGHGKGKGQGHGKKSKFGPYDVVTDDHGSCGNTWAVDTEKRTFKVKQNKDGTFTVTRTDRGTFRPRPARAPALARRRASTARPSMPASRAASTATCAARSPAAPSTRLPRARPTAGLPTCGSRPSSARARRSRASSDSADCKFNFHYHARGQGLKFHNWYDLGRARGRS